MTKDVVFTLQIVSIFLAIYYGTTLIVFPNNYFTGCGNQ